MNTVLVNSGQWDYLKPRTDYEIIAIGSGDGTLDYDGEDILVSGS